MSVSEENRRLRRLRRERLSLLSGWYGGEFAATEIAAHISTPHTLSDGIRSVMSQLETPEARALRTLRDRWPEVAGVWISRMTLPAEWKDGVLVLEVPHSALLRELKPSLELLREAVSRHSTECPCHEVRLVIAGGTAARKSGRSTSK
jgi:hypothetical protein